MSARSRLNEGAREGTSAGHSRVVATEQAAALSFNQRIQNAVGCSENESNAMHERGISQLDVALDKVRLQLKHSYCEDVEDKSRSQIYSPVKKAKKDCEQ